MTFTNCRHRFRYSAAGLLCWLAIQAVCIAGDCITWGWMLGFIDRPVIFADRPLLLALLHLFIAGLVTATYLALVRDRQERWFWAGLAATMSVFMPVTGTLFTGTGFIVAESPETSRFVDEIEDVILQKPREKRHDTDIHTTINESPDAIDERFDIALLRSLDVEPLYDILLSKDSIYKRNALNKITRNPSRRTVKLLRDCLNDNNPDIRFYASSALSRIEEDLNTTLTYLKEQLHEHPDNLELILKLTDHCLTVAELKITPPATEAFYLENALNLLEKKESDYEVVWRRVQILCHLKRFHEALNALDTVPDLSLNMQKIRCDVLLRLKHYDILQQTCNSLAAEIGSTDEPFRKALHFWSHENDYNARRTA